jgi:hypothetical protein
LAHPWPARMDPFHAFASYPSYVLSAETEVCLVGPRQQALERFQKLIRLKMVNYTNAVLPTETEINTLLHAATQHPQPASTLIKSIEVERKAFVLRSLVWLIKLGILQVSR